jgi:two-component system chemotaxis response regulator CheB
MTAPRRTRILIVDDSAVMRSLLRAVVSCDAGLEVVGTAVDGASALDSLQILRPDIILLDVEMPVMDGLATLRVLRRRWSGIPVIMCSSLAQRGAKVTIEALACGAADYVTKPSGQSNRESATQKLAAELIPRIRALTSRSSSSSIIKLLPFAAGVQPGNIGAAPVVRNSLAPTPQSITSTPTIVAIGVSTGGPAALDVLLSGLPERFPLPVLIVQHMPELFTRLLAQRLNGHCRLRVREACEGDPLRAGCVYIARGNWHMETVAPSLPEGPATVRLCQGPHENHCRPSVDVLFRSAAKVYGSGVLAVVLTGMGSDGLNACRMIRERGGTVLAQDEATSTVWGMPGAVVNAGLAQKVLPLEQIAPEILRITGQSTLLSPQLGRDHNNQAVS